ncbi:hypothetical protein MBLNU459_g1636t2 [Dothideomycetes sp. NU459]
MSPAKKTVRSALDVGKRTALAELAPNASLVRKQADGKGRKSMPSSPLKRSYNNVLGDDKGLMYLKRRRMSHDQALNSSLSTAARDQKRPQTDAIGFRPLSPPSSRGYTAVRTGPSQAKAMASVPEELSNAEQDAHSEDDSGRDSQNSNATRGSFSSLINYDPSSQQAHIPPSVSAHTTHASARPSRRMTFALSSQAEMLRLRLKVAIYKVRTNQINVPFARLRVRSPPRPAAPPVRRTRERPALSSDSPDLLPMAPPTRSMLPPERPLPHGLLPAPVLTESVYSRRYMPVQETLSSSPPIVHASLPRNRTGHLATPTADRDSLDSEATELADDHSGNEGRFFGSPLESKRDGVSSGGILQ